MSKSEKSRKYHIALLGELDFIKAVNATIEQDMMERGEDITVNEV